MRYAIPSVLWALALLLSGSSSAAPPTFGLPLFIDPPTSAVAAPSFQERPASATNGNTVVTVWEDSRFIGQGIFGQVVKADATPLGTFSFQIARSGFAPAIGCSAGVCLVAWQGTEGLLAARIDSTGAMLDAAPRVLSATSSSSLPGVGCGPSSCLVAWAASGLVSARRVSMPLGTVLDATPLVLGAGDEPAVAFDGTEFLVAFASTDVVVRWVTPAGTLGNVVPLPTSADSEVGVKASCAASGTCLVAWERTNSTTSNLQGVRLTRAGGLLDATARTLLSPTNGGVSPFACSVLDTFLVGGHIAAGANLDVRASIWNVGSSTPAAAHTLASATASAGACAGVDGGFVAAWSSFAAGPVFADVVSSRVDPLTGNALDNPAVLTSTAPTHEKGTAAAWDATHGNALVVWEDSRGTDSDIRAARVGLDGTVLDSPTLLIAGGVVNQTAPAVACGGTTCLVAWLDGLSSIKARRVTNGAVDATDITVVATSAFTPLSVTAGNGGLFLVGFTGSSEIGAVRVNQNAVVLDNPALRSLGQSERPFLGGATFGAGTFLLAYNQFTGVNDQLRVLRVTPAGTLPSPGGTLVVDTLSTLQLSRQPITFDGTHFVVAWIDGTDRLTQRLDGLGAPVGTAATIDAGFALRLEVDGTRVLLSAFEASATLVTLGQLVDGGLVDVGAGEIRGSAQSEGSLIAAAGRGFMALSATSPFGAWRAMVIPFSADGGLLVPDAGVPDAGGNDAGGSDAGGSDAGGSDAGGSDAGGSDAGGSDAGGSDAGGSDAGGSDAGGSDAGVADDAGSPDAGTSDGGSTGPDDAGASTDGGSGPRVFIVGCACNGLPGGEAWALWGLVLLAVRARRRTEP